MLQLLFPSLVENKSKQLIFPLLKIQELASFTQVMLEFTPTLKAIGQFRTI